MKILQKYPGFVVVYKAPGIGVHREFGADDQTLQDGILPQLRLQLNIQQLYIVHRLDKVTSGLMIVATEQSAAARLGKMFEDREIEKYYIAISDKKPKKKQGMVKGDMEKARSSAWKLVRGTSDPAITQFFSFSLGGGQRLFVVKPLTGKTHQIRVALKSVGSPVLGDRLYGSKESQADRTYLHAYAMRFHWQGEELKIICPPLDGQLFESHEHLQNTLLAARGFDYKNPWDFPWPKPH
ncbi:TIGR01621 family pseudouridine synthase [bacterium]|nr:TIGR01621 family pseudouridine synthase [bacterium]